MSNKPQPTGRILLKNVRLGFPNLFDASQVNDQGAPKFSAMLILPTDHPQLDEINAKIKAVAKEKWAAKADGILKGLEKQDRMALHDGDTKPDYDGLPGNLFVNASAQENAAPTVIDRDRSPLSRTSGRPYAGCYVNASIEFWAQDNKFGQRINAQLRGVQFYSDGDAFSAGCPADADEFEEVTAGADADEFA